MAFSQYAWASGHDVALASLHNIETQLKPYNYRVVGGATYPVGIRSQPIDAYPVRRRTLDGAEQGNGTVNHTLEMVLTTYALERVYDLYFSGGTVVSAAMTFYLRRHDLNDFARYNGYLILPSPQRGDIEYLRQNVVRVRWTLSKLVAL